MQLNGEPIYEKYQHVGISASSAVKHAPMAAPAVDEEGGSKKRRARKRRKLADVAAVAATDEQRPTTTVQKYVLIDDLVSWSGVVLRRQFRPGPAAINITRQRMFYAQPARRPSGSLIHGLPPQRMSAHVASSDRSLNGIRHAQQVIELV